MASTEQREVHLELWTQRRSGLMVGEPERMPEGWMAGTWMSDRPSRVLFGLTYLGSPTHMAYELGEGPGCMDPTNLITEVHKSDRFYFDAGSNGRPIWTTYTELARVFRDLGLMD